MTCRVPPTCPQPQPTCTPCAPRETTTCRTTPFSTTCTTTRDDYCAPRVSTCWSWGSAPYRSPYYSSYYRDPYCDPYSYSTYPSYRTRTYCHSSPSSEFAGAAVGLGILALLFGAAGH